MALHLRRRRLVVPLLVCAALLAASAAPASAEGRTTRTSWTTSKAFVGAVAALRAGDTLELAPGTYDIGAVKPTLHQGTSSAPIRLTAADPDRPPHLRGHLILEDADHWSVTHLKITATVPDEPALKMAGGTGWSVTDSEFTGAASTRDYANVAIDSNRYTRTAPSDWSFSDNCVHDAAPRPEGDPAGYHNLYVNAEGGGRGGLITRNVMYGAPGGANIKIGAGGNTAVRGAWGVRVEYNTLFDAAWQIFLFGDIDDISVRRNLLVRSTGGPSVSTGQYFHSLPGGAVRVDSQDNYGYQLGGRPTFALSSPTSSYLDAGNFEGSDPRFAVGCGRFRPTEPAAARYGRYGAEPHDGTPAMVCTAAWAGETRRPA
ncbi:hypothetical protein WDZ17_11030 [Pseudokineococcus basanitobsidens]|uniref:Parallel beta helix pectate lyase-like protein n=1 Tax=Pseudokineococcus basanitobsidens TaxID=1926649 RepID=A0ABU8RL92_9ACTN